MVAIFLWFKCRPVSPMNRLLARRPVEADDELEAILNEEADEMFDELDPEEQKAGLGPWKK